MVLIFVILGMLCGAILGQFGGAVLGALAGWGLAKMLLSSDDKAGPSAAATSTAAQDQALIRGLEQRVHALESQVKALQACVQRLSEGDALAMPEAAPAGVRLADIPALQETITISVPPPQVPEPATSPWTEAGVVEQEAVADTTAETGLPEAQTGLPEAPDISSTTVASQPPAVHPIESDWPAQDIPPAAQARVEAPRTPPRSFKDHVPERLRPLIFGGNTIVKIGVLILFLGLSFLLRYVADQVTVPVELRYAGVALLGAVLLGSGWRLRGRGGEHGGGADYGLILQGAGVGVFYLTTLAAMKLHPLLPVAMGFAIMVLVTAFASLLAVAQNAPWLAMVASAAGFATPVLVSTGHGHHIALFSYLAILDLGILGMAWFRAWRPLNLIGFTGTFTLASAWASRSYTPAAYPGTQGFLLLFFLMFTVIGVLFARRALAQGDEIAPDAPLSLRASAALRQLGRVDSTLVFGVPLAAYGLQYLMVRDDPWLPALSALGFGLFYALLGAFLWRSGRVRYTLLAEAYVVVGVLFGTLSIPLAFEGAWTGATWAVEAAGMYWLGTRQHRGYTRAFATLLITVAALRMLHSLGWSEAPDQPFITGSMLGMGMLAGSALSIAWVHRQARAAGQVRQAPWEAASTWIGWYLALGALATLPWMAMKPLWASVVLAGMAPASLWLGRRLAQPELVLGGRVLPAVAIAGFASTLHQVTGQAMLANGLQGLSAALLIGLGLLASAWLEWRDAWRQATAPGSASDTAPAWPMASSMPLVAGLAVMSMSLLFVMPLAHAVLIWPLLALAMLRASLKLAHPALAAMWAMLSVGSGLAFALVGPAVWPDLAAAPLAPSGDGPLGGLAWWTPLILSTCTFTAALWLHADAKRAHGWRMPWVSSPPVQWLMLGAVLWWWAQTLPPEMLRWLHAQGQLAWSSATMSLWVTLTSFLLLLIARRHQWSLMGQAASLSIPMWMAALLTGPVSHGAPPLDDLGWLAWPVALAWHALSLRQHARWWPRQPQAWMHVGGLWFFAFLACWQVQWCADQFTIAGTAWQDLGSLLVPLGLTAMLSSRWGRQRWPLDAFAFAYRFIGALPLAAGVLLWLIWGLAQPGEPAPLPYLPVLNPLEIGQGLALLVLLAWSRQLPEGAPTVLSSRGHQLALLGGSAFLLLTTMVLRACHHWADVPWNADALMASRLAQAALSVTWALTGVALMVTGHRRLRRIVWGLGAGLLGVVVVKLFFVELADHGGLYRIVSFIVVGLLLLVVGYFAPVPPADDKAPARAGQEGA